jgi:hypothetical protein
MRFAGTAISSGDYINAARNAGGNINDVLAKTTPDWGISSKMSMKNNAEESIAGMKASANVATAGINASAFAQQSAFQAEAIKAQGEAAASATEAQGLSGMIGDIGGGLMGAFKPKGGGASAPSFGLGIGMPSFTGNKLSNFGGPTFGAF